MADQGGQDMDMRQLKALELAARSKITFDGDIWTVPSQSNNGKYRVRLLPAPSCSCEDFQLRQQECKHILAVRLVMERDHGGKAPEIVTDAVPKRATYSQPWRAYNLAQHTEKKRLEELLFDLARDATEPPLNGGRTPTSIADVVFACCFKVYSTFSSRRFACDLNDAHERGYLSKPMHPNKVNTHMERDDLTPILRELIVRSSLPLRAVETDFAGDSSGFSTSRFVRWYDEKYGSEKSGREWVKVHIMTGVKTNVVTAIEILDKHAGDCPQLPGLLNTTEENFKVKEVSLDKAYLSHDNLAAIDGAGAVPYVPFKSNNVAGEAGGLWERMFHYFQFRREEFLKHYHKRSNVESTFSMVKAKFRDHVRSKTDVAMKNEVLCKFLCHNICCVIMEQCVLGIEPVFWKDEPSESRAILPMIRPG